MGDVVDIPDSESDNESNDLPSDINISLQIINPKIKRDYRIVKVKRQEVYTLETIQEVIESYTSNTEFGYVEPGKGLKGKREWIFSEEDVKSMVQKHKKKKELHLWCYDDSVSTSTQSKTLGKSSKSHSPEHGPETKRPRTTKYDCYVKKLAKVDEIFKELDKKHHGKLSAKQLNAWAHLVQSRKYASLDVSPDMPFLGGRRKQRIPTTQLLLKTLKAALLLHHSQPALLAFLLDGE